MFYITINMMNIVVHDSVDVGAFCKSIYFPHCIFRLGLADMLESQKYLQIGPYQFT